MNGYCLERIDALSFLENTPGRSFDLIITDPPYESLEKYRKMGTTTRLKHSTQSSNDWFEIFPNDRFPELFAQLYRVLKDNSHLYMFCDQETMFIVKPMAEEAGFRFWKPIVWDKVVIGMGYHYRSRYEFILFFEKGKKKLHDLGVPDILIAKKVRSGYPTEKPVDVSRILIEQSSNPGDVVLDPFCGSGSVGVAALACGRNFHGCDISLSAYEIAERRLGDAFDLSRSSR